MYKIRRDDIKKMIEAVGSPQAFAKGFLSLCASENAKKNNSGQAWGLTEIGLRNLFEAVVAPCDEIFGGRVYHQEYQAYKATRQEGTFTGMALFGDIVGSLISNDMIQAYNNMQKIGPELVTEKKFSHIEEIHPGITTFGKDQEIGEGQPYPVIKFGEKGAATKATKNGFIVELTEELVWGDQTGQIASRAASAGEEMGKIEEKMIVNAVIDKNSNVYAPRSAGSHTYGALYSHATYNNYAGTGTGAYIALEDYSDLDAVRAYAAAIKDDNLDENERQVVAIDFNTLLVPWALQSTGLQIVNATEIQKWTNTLAQSMKFGNYYNRVKVLASPLLDTASAADWYFGNPKAQFIKHVVWPLEMQINMNGQFDRDVLVAYKARYFAGVGAKDTKHFIKVDGAV